MVCTPANTKIIRPIRETFVQTKTIRPISEIFSQSKIIRPISEIFGHYVNLITPHKIKKNTNCHIAILKWTLMILKIV